MVRPKNKTMMGGKTKTNQKIISGETTRSYFPWKWSFQSMASEAKVTEITHITVHNHVNYVVIMFILLF